MSWRRAGPEEGPAGRICARGMGTTGLPPQPRLAVRPPRSRSSIRKSTFKGRTRTDLASYVELGFHEGKLPPQKQVQEIHAKSK